MTYLNEVPHKQIHQHMIRSCNRFFNHWISWALMLLFKQDQYGQEPQWSYPVTWKLGTTSILVTDILAIPVQPQTTSSKILYQPKINAILAITITQSYFRYTIFSNRPQ